jgi:hypothetical protein
MKKEDQKEPTSVTTLTVRKQEIPVTMTSLLQTSLKFFPENPRIYSLVRSDGKEPTQPQIYERLLEQEHVKQLIQDIRRNGGLIEPLLVRDGTMEVLEGNSRLAAYRYLAKTDNPINWSKVKCTVLPATVDESLIFAILGQHHIKGKKDWAPFEQAGFLYRRHKNHHIEYQELATEIGLPKSRVVQLIDTYQFMLDHKQHETSRWSYFDEFLKSPKIRKVRKKHPQFDKLIIGKIDSGEIPRAVDVRDDLPLICAASEASLKQFLNGTVTFSEAVADAREAGSKNVELKKLERFRAWIVKPEVEKALKAARGQTKSQIDFELTKLLARIQALKKAVKKA